MTEENLKPSIIDTIKRIEERIYKFGLGERDLLILLRDRMSIKGKYGAPTKPSLKMIETMLNTIKQFEKELLRNREKYLTKVEEES